VRVIGHGAHQLRRHHLRPCVYVVYLRGWHLQVGEVQNGELRIIQVESMDRPDHPPTKMFLLIGFHRPEGYWIVTCKNRRNWVVTFLPIGFHRPEGHWIVTCKNRRNWVVTFLPHLFDLQRLECLDCFVHASESDACSSFTESPLFGRQCLIHQSVKLLVGLFGSSPSPGVVLDQLLHRLNDFHALSRPLVFRIFP